MDSFCAAERVHVSVWERKRLLAFAVGIQLQVDCTDSGCSPLLAGQTGYSSSVLVPYVRRANKETLALLLLIFSVEFCR